jgi:hypothetical protein
MQELKNVEFSELIDMLAHHTATYSKLLVDGDRGERFEYSKKLIKLIQAEIESRNQSAEKTLSGDQGN